MGRGGLAQVQLNEALGPSGGGGLFATDGGVARRPQLVDDAVALRVVMPRQSASSATSKTALPRSWIRAISLAM